MEVVRKQDKNSYVRGESKKIRGEDKYLVDGKLIHMGSVKMSLNYDNGALVVFLYSAHGLAGKKSQDPYANVFLIEDEEYPHPDPTKRYQWKEGQKVIYQEDHEKTEVSNRNLNPVFKDKFIFQTNPSGILPDISKKSLVISIWDKDSKSRDDYMAGVTLPLRNVRRFNFLDSGLTKRGDWDRADSGSDSSSSSSNEDEEEEGKKTVAKDILDHKKIVEVPLQVQENDGYPKRLFDVDKLFGGLKLEPVPVPFNDGWDLTECNNRLVTYIDRARVLRQAYQLKKSLSEVQLNDRTSVVMTEKNSVILEQMEKIKSLRVAAARRRVEVEQRRKAAMEGAERSERRYKTQMTVLKERMATLDSLAKEEANLRCKECSNSSLREYYRGGLSVRRQLNYKPAAVHAEKVEIKSLVLTAELGRSSRDEAFEKIIIKIRNEFHQKFLASLNEARKKYKKQGKLEITIEEDILRIYQTLIRQRADVNGIQYSLSGLSQLESSRHYKARMRQLVGDIEGLRQLLRKRNDEMSGLSAGWAVELREIDAVLEASLAKLRDVMGKLSYVSVTKETEFDEVAAYQQLLDFETVRVSQPERRHRATVRTSTSRRSASSSAFGSAAYVAGGSEYSHSSKARQSRSSSSKGRTSYG